ncbi:MAG: hypothetical protein JXA68_02255 [Ignavibacteriales bacterium]|nr:hypothetical protein [Ignavibacteriales bacterium]
MKILKISRIFAGLLLFTAVFNLPMGYYHFLRAAVILVAILNIFIELKYINKIWLVFFTITIIIFNPIIPFKFSSGVWTFIDILFGIIFIISGLSMRKA